MAASAPVKLLKQKRAWPQRTAKKLTRSCREYLRKWHEMNSMEKWRKIFELDFVDRSSSGRNDPSRNP